MFVPLIQMGQLQPQLWLSGQRLLYAFGLAVLIGVPVGRAIVSPKGVEAAIDPRASIFYVTLRLSLGPLVIL